MFITMSLGFLPHQTFFMDDSVSAPVMASSPKPSLKLIAEKAGVSMMTVSRILRNHPNHDPETRARVLKIAQELGYKKNPLISALMANIRHKKPGNVVTAIALIQSKCPEHWGESFQASLRKGVYDTATDHGFELEAFALNKDAMTPQRLIKILQTRGYRGLVLEPYSLPSLCDELDLSAFAGISIANPLTQPGFNNVEPDYHAGLLMAVENVLKKGYKRIGFISEKDEPSHSRNRRLSAFAFSEPGKANGIRLPLLLENSDSADLKKKLTHWIQENKPDVILTATQSILGYLVELGFKIPEDFGLVNLELNEDIGHRAGTYFNWYEMGSIAAKHVIESILSNNLGPVSNPVTTIVSPLWADGKSIRQQFSSTV